jgi:hypothetical protein
MVDVPWRASRHRRHKPGGSPPSAGLVSAWGRPTRSHTAITNLHPQQARAGGRRPDRPTQGTRHNATDTPRAVTTTGGRRLGERASPTAVETWVAVDGRWDRGRVRVRARVYAVAGASGWTWRLRQVAKASFTTKEPCPWGRVTRMRDPPTLLLHTWTRRARTAPPPPAAGSPRTHPAWRPRIRTGAVLGIEQPHLGTALDRAGPGRDGAQLDGEPDRARGTVGIVGRSLRRRGGATTRHGPVDRWAGGRRRRVRRRRDRSRRLGRGGCDARWRLGAAAG